MRKLLVAFVLLAAGALPAMFSASATSATRIKIGDDYFVRAAGVPKVTVAKGTKVRWAWTGDNPHNVKAIKGPSTFGSTTKMSGSYTKTMRKRGTYTIICTVHGAGNQKMKLIVK